MSDVSEEVDGVLALIEALNSDMYRGHNMADDRDVIRFISDAEYVAVVGSRHWPVEDIHRVAWLIGYMNADIPAVVVTGGAPGVDKAAEKFANERGLRTAIVRPSTGGLHAAADYMSRNTIIVRGAEIVVAFWDGESNGTRDSINKALDFHRLCVVCVPGEKTVIWRYGRKA